MRARALICFFFVLFGLVACGQKGPLYMPEKPGDPEQTQQETSTQ